MLVTVLLRQLGCDVMLMPSHAGDGTVESCWRWQCRDDMAVTRYRCRVMLVTELLNHTGDGAAKATWPRRNVDAESCW
jgi:hypothetical protein